MNKKFISLTFFIIFLVSVISFTLVFSAPTEITSVLINSTFGTNSSNENITAYPDIPSNSSQKNIFNWFSNNKPLTVVNLPFEGGSNSTYTRDYSGNNQNITVRNAVWNSTGGYDSFGAYSFTYADSPQISINLSNVDTNKSFTVSTWIKTSDATHYAIIASKCNTGGWVGFFLQNDWGRIRLSVNGNGVSAGDIEDTTSIADNRWHYIVGVRERGGKIRIYVDGVEKKNITESNVDTSSSYTLAIGNIYNDNDAFFTGMIDEFMLFNRSLSATEILLLNSSRPDMIASSELSGNEIWQACATPNDGLSDGTTICSNNLTVLDTTTPTFTTFSNQTIQYNSALNYTIVATDSSGISCYTVNDTTFDITCSGFLKNNTFLNISLNWINITVNDTFNNLNSGLMFVNVTDTTAPIVNITYPLNNTNYSISITTLNYTATDNFGLDRCWWSNSSGAWNSTTQNPATNWTDLTNKEGWNNWTVYCNDSYRNLGRFNVRFIIDTIAPNITLNFPIDNYTNNSFGLLNLTFNCSAADNFALKNISLFITNSANSSFTLNQTKLITSTNANANWTIGLANGNYTWNCLAYDNLGNFNWSTSNRTLTIGPDITPPAFTSISNQTIYQNTALGYQISATDSFGISCFTVNDTRFNINCSGQLKNNTVLSDVELYWLNITTNDTSNNLASSDMYVNVTSLPIIGLTLISPIGNLNVTQNQTFTVSVNVSCSNTNCGEINVSLDPTANTVYNFTTCGATGASGPTQANCNANYTSTTLAGLVNVTSGIQNWTVPTTGTYTIRVVGAAGGGSSGSTIWGNGSIMQGDFYLTQGTLLQILVGQIGAGSSWGGGGGGSFVANGSNYSLASPLIIAGGGGGGSGLTGSYYPGFSATIITNGTDGQGVTGNKGTNGTGGNGGGSSYSGSGGGGFYTSGGSSSRAGAGGRSFISGGTGSPSSYAVGGFGGGGGNGWWGGGGGGGYSGGGGGSSDYYGGGGGGSYNSGTNQNNLAGVNSREGYVTITYSGETKQGLVNSTVGATPFYTTTQNPYNLTLNNGQSQIINWLVNATGTIWNNYTFFVYVNKTSDMTIINITAKWNVTITNDTGIAPPIITITYPQSTNYTTNVSVLNYTVSGNNISVCWWSNSSGVWNSTTQNPATNWTDIISLDGTNTWTVYCNGTNNTLGTSSATFYRDLNSPTAVLTFPENNTYSTNATFNFTANLSDNLGIKNASLNIYNSTNSLINKTTINYATGITQTVLGITVTLVNGVYNWFYNIFDLAENSFTTSNNTITIDSTSPIVNITYPRNNTNYTTNISNINYTSSDNLAVNFCWWSNSSGVWNSTTQDPGINWTSLTSNEGWNNWTVYCNDTLNNVNSSKVSFYKDSVSPGITLNSPQENYTNTIVNALNISFNCSADDNLALKNISLYLTNSSNNNFVLNQTKNITGTSANANWTLNLSVGSYTWNCLAYDSLGNFNWGTNRTILLQSNTAPTINLTSPTNNTVLNKKNSIILNVTFYDVNLDNSTIWFYGGYPNGTYTLLNTSYNQTNGTNTVYNWSVTSSGKYNWTAIAGDERANSTNYFFYFNLTNFSISCETGGSYQQNALVLVQGTIYNETITVPNYQINLSIYDSDNNLDANKNLTTTSDGGFKTTFSTLAVGSYILNATANYRGYNETCQDTFQIGSSASLVLDKIATIHNISNSIISYNITLRLTNKGGSDVTNTNITDTDSINSPYDIGTISANSSTEMSYIKNFTRNSTNYYYTLSYAQAFGINSYSSNQISSNSNSINITIPNQELGQQLTLVKNVYYNSENSTSVNYTISIEIVNSGGIDLSNIALIDSDLGISTTINLNKTQNYNYSNSVLIDKAASNSNKLFVKTTATVNSITYSSNQINVRIPGFGGPADAIVAAPSSVVASTSFNTIITVENQNLDVGQDFVIDYWITSENENTNYSSGQQTIYVAASGTSDLTATLTAPSSAGTYRLRALVTWAGGTATSYDSFSVTSEGDNGGGNGNGGGSGGGSGGSSNGNNGVSGTNQFDVDFTLKSTATFSGSQEKSKTFTLDGSTGHTIEIKSIINNSVTFIIYSNPITITMSIGETKKVDVNNDGFYDIKVKLNGIKNGTVDYSLEKIDKTTTAKVTGKTTDEIICNIPYIRYGKECCLDRNNNSICDIDDELEAENNKKSNETQESEIINKISERNLLVIIGVAVIILLIIIITLIIIQISKNKKCSHKNKEEKKHKIKFSKLHSFIARLSSKIHKSKLNLNEEVHKELKYIGKHASLKSIEGKHVYSLDGYRIGEVKKVYLNHKQGKIHGWLIKLDKRMVNELKKDYLLIKHEFVKSTKEIMILKHNLDDYLKK
ncbi:MAG: LamG-like jellyroll fold domain-containing protein [Candidatus Pacearchaeota archaeon]|jgi:sporulation protein YlmC with PRC-barrel domain